MQCEAQTMMEMSWELPPIEEIGPAAVRPASSVHPENGQGGLLMNEFGEVF